MKTSVVLYGALLSTSVFLAQREPWEEKPIDYDQVKPFPKPKAVTISDESSVKSKPQLHIAEGMCHPYLAVNAEGKTSSGHMPTGSDAIKRQGPTLGYQVYGRSNGTGASLPLLENIRFRRCRYETNLKANT
ncbi:unnamed protein product [Hyaloperonospora brassicae]|uniref:Uncharacterized protein n=1 Tax=Hyaloperonospora brassicae TaxID=162125 RepID=A0AAV0TB18_HYABA|nr:unnamed protein product [Hyaloperonospora brassicae]